MASESTVGEGKDGARERQRYSENKVYTRKIFKGTKKQNIPTTTNTGVTNPPESSATDVIVTTTTNTGVTNPPEPSATDAIVATTTTTTVNTTISPPQTDDNNASIISKPDIDIVAATTVSPTNNLKSTEVEENNNNSVEAPPTTLPSEDVDLGLQQPISHVDAAPDDTDTVSSNPPQVVVPCALELEHTSANGVTDHGEEENGGNVNFPVRSRQEMRQLRRKLESQLDTVRNLVKKIEEKEEDISGLGNSRVIVKDVIDNGGKRGPLAVASGVVHREVIRPPRPLNQLSISVLENSQGVSENLEKEKRTPKANQFYRNSEFLLAKDKFPPAESNKKSKSNGRKHGVEQGQGFGMGSKAFKSCSTLLDKLMKHKHGWVFNTPVDVKGLGLNDYYTIIKHPMDLGSVKSRLNKNWYKSPREFAEDVRLTFHNAMTYNPEGQDVHVMADQLSKIFEDRWTIIESDYIHEMRFGSTHETGHHTPTSRKAPPLRPPNLDMGKILNRSDSMRYTVDTRAKSLSTTPSARTPAPKKPKAKDLHKRDMTYDEKQKLSNHLSSLPVERLDNIVQIIKKRNSALFQHNDEIEVDIDSVDAETLWELDRFVTNYKKSLSKNKRKAELFQSRRNAQETAAVPALVEPSRDAGTADDRIVSTSSPNRVQTEGDNQSRSSSSSSSSSDSGSSSSDSDSDSSSSSESDAQQSPRT